MHGSINGLSELDCVMAEAARVFQLTIFTHSRDNGHILPEYAFPAD